MRPFLKNFFSILALGTMLSLALVFPPESSVQQVYLNCPGGLEKPFPDMLSCAKELAEHIACSCSRPRSTWSWAYWILIPTAIGLIAAFLFRAKALLAVAMLIATIAVFGSLTLVLLFTFEKIDGEGLAYSLALGLPPFAGLSVLAFGIAIGGRYYWRRAMHTT